MNIKITGNSVTFKITLDELDILLSGEKVEEKLLLSPEEFTMTITPYAQDSEQPFKLTLERSSFHFILNVTTASLKKLSDMGKNRDGIFTQVGGTVIALQVDVRKDSRLQAN